MSSRFLRASAIAIVLAACGNQDLPVDYTQQPPQASMPTPAGTGAAPLPAANGGAGTEPAKAGVGGPVLAAGSPAAAGTPGGGSMRPPSAGAGGAPAAGGAPSAAPLAMGGAGAPAPSGPSGIHLDNATGELVFRTAPIELESSQESYTCFAATLDQDVVVDGFIKSAQPYVHHAQFVNAILPEPDGISECKQQFKLTWLPIFLAGAGPSELRFDEGVGHVLPAGTQLVLQMHLFNTSEKTVKQAVEIRMTRSKSANPTPVVPWAIGSADIRIPAHGTGKAQKVCTQTGPAKVLAVFPHMHTTGRRMTIEVGKSLDAMRPLYTRDPFNFDDQRMEKMTLSLDTGDLLRVTCDYMNTSDSEVTFGESSTEEMCFFVGFAHGDASAGADCPDLWEHLLEL